MRNALRKRLTLAVAAAALGGGLALSAGPAVAAPAQVGPGDRAAIGTSEATEDASVLGTAPACVRRDVIKHEKKVTVGNDCGKAMHLKVVIDWGPDSRCLTYQHGEEWTWHWGRGSYGKVVTC
ncbi:hypothetical protein ACFY12_27830 [Streptomyces sp. NPDC001339]|uniref:hypothetical protein n=1 Tax=Streptomyces sp. NPDC001339 TaxID=3364563 RepID=UPI00368BD878